jgi:hypothetical protein
MSNVLARTLSARGVRVVPNDDNYTSRGVEDVIGAEGTYTQNAVVKYELNMQDVRLGSNKMNGA